MTAQVDICIIGMGPAGFGAAIGFAEAGYARDVLCIEAGRMPGARQCAIQYGRQCCNDYLCHMACGLGGASLRSGGKISMSPAGLSGIASILSSEEVARECLSTGWDLFSKFFRTDAKQGLHEERSVAEAAQWYSERGFSFSHYDSYNVSYVDLSQGYERMLDHLHSSGMQVVVNSRVVDICALPNDQGYMLSIQSDGHIEHVLARRCVLAIGRSGHQVLGANGLRYVRAFPNNRLDIGVRLEFPAAAWPTIDCDHNDLKLRFEDARTFCVCKDGYVAPYKAGDVLLTEGGRDYTDRTGRTNLSVVLRMHFETSEAKAATVAEIWELSRLAQGGKQLVCQPLDQYLDATKCHERLSIHVPAYARIGKVAACYPASIHTALRERVGYFVSRLMPWYRETGVMVYAPEVDYYWPCISVGDGFAVEETRLFAVGDCTGKFRGVLQAFSTGLHCAQVMARSSCVSEPVRT